MELSNKTRQKQGSISYQKTVLKNCGEKSAIRWNMDFNNIVIENIVTI